MKKIYFIVYLLLASAISFAQTVVNRAGPANTVNDYRWQGGYNMFVPRYADTTAANVQKGIDSCGAQIYTYDVNGYWYRACSPKRWVQITTPDNVNPRMLGTILNQVSFSSLTGYTNTGSSATIVGNAINFPTGNSNFSQYLSYNYVTGLERWTQEIKIVVNEKNASSTGIGLGISSINSSGGAYDLDMVAKFDMTNGANSGRLSLFSGAGLPKLDSTATLLTFSVGDTLIFTAGRDLNEFTINAYNKTTNSANITLLYNIIGTQTTPNTGNFSIWALGGDFTVYSYNIFSRQIVGANLFCLGDSKLGPYGLSDYYQRSVTKLNSYFSSSLANCGNGDKTAETLQLVPEIISLHPKYVFLYTGSNDIRNGIPAGTTQANIDTITARLQRAGIIVLHGLLYETAISQTTLNTFLESTYPTTYINTYAAIQNCGDCLQSDGAHLNAVGHTKASYAIQVSGLVPPDFRLSMKDETLGSGLLQSIHQGGNSFGRNILIGSNEDLDFGIKRNNIKMIDLSESSVGTQPIINLPAFAFGANPVYTRASAVTLQSALYGGTTVLNIGVAGSDSANGAGIRLANFNVFGTNDFIQYQVPAGAFTRVGGYGAYLITNFSGAKIGTLNTDGQGNMPVDLVVNLTTEATVSSTGFSVVDTLQVGKARSLATADSAYVKDPITGKFALAPYGGGGGGGGVNIYNADSSLSGNRTVDLNNFSLTFQGDAPGPGVFFDLNAAVGGFQVLADTVSIQGSNVHDLTTGDISMTATQLLMRQTSSTYYTTEAATSKLAGWETAVTANPTVRLVASDGVFDNSIYVSDSIRATGNISTVISDTTTWKPVAINVSTGTLVTGSWFGGSSSVAWNAITDPTGTQTLSFDDGEITSWTNGSNDEVFLSIASNSLTAGTALKMTSSSLTGGNLVDLTVSSTALAAGNEAVNIVVSGANASSSITATGMRISVTNTGTGSTNVGLAVTASGAGTNNAIVATGNITATATITADGNVRLNGSSSGFIVNRRDNPTAAAWTIYSASGDLSFFSSADRFSLTSGGNLGLGQTTPTAVLHLKAGTATASTAPIKLASGTFNTTAETGAIEYNGTNLTFVRTGTTRESIFTGDDGGSAPATNTIGVIADYYGTSATRVLTTPNSWASVVIDGVAYRIPLYTP